MSMFRKMLLIALASSMICILRAERCGKTTCDGKSSGKKRLQAFLAVKKLTSLYFHGTNSVCSVKDIEIQALEFPTLHERRGLSTRVHQRLHRRCFRASLSDTRKRRHPSPGIHACGVRFLRRVIFLLYLEEFFFPTLFCRPQTADTHYYSANK